MAGFNGDLDPRDNRDLRRVLADAMPDTFRWLLSHGIRFYGPMPEPPHKQAAHAQRAAQLALVHRPPRPRRPPRRRRHRLLDARRCARRATPAASIGVDCETPQGTRRFRARGGVVLASGDFTSDPELKGQFMGPQQAKIDGVNITATGDGQKLALPLGARILNGDLALGPELRFVPPQRRTCCSSCRPGAALANLMAWSLEHMPSALLRPFVMSFVTTALAPSLGAVRGRRDPGQRGRRALHRRDRRAGVRAARSAATRSPTSCSTRASPRSSRPGRTSSPPRRASPMPTSTTTAATGPTCS